MKKMLILLLLGVLVCSYSDLIIPGQPRPNRPIFTPEVKPNPLPTPQKPFTPKPNLKPVVKYTDHENLNAVLWMQTSAEFKGLCYQAYNTAKMMLDLALKDKTWCADLEQLEKQGYENLKPAVILDIDETVLDNTIYQGSLVRENKAYNGREWDNWCREVRATAIAGAADFCNYAIEKGVDVVYLTNRRNTIQKETEENLKKEGFPVTEVKEENTTPAKEHHKSFLGKFMKFDRKGKAYVLPKVKERTKNGRRQAVAEKNRIIMLVGDNCCDFAGLFNEATIKAREEVATKYASFWGTKWIILPNPSYGDWENAVLDYKYPQQDERFKMKYEQLRK